jgi:multidrug efflux pump subunit AcrB
MVVDDAIIIGESIYRYRESGLATREAAIEGLKTVVRPVLGTILTTMIAFVPIYFVPGIVGDFAVEIPTIVIIMLAASFVEATTILPAHLGMESKKKGQGKKWEPPGGKLFIYLSCRYRKLLEWSLSHRFRALGFALAFIIIGGVAGMFFTRIEMFPADHANKIWIMAEVDRGKSLAFTERSSVKIEKIIEKLPKEVVHAYRTSVGVTYDPEIDNMQKMRNAFLATLNLTPASDRDMSAHEVKDFIISHIKKNGYDKEIKTNFWIYSGGPPVGQPLEIQVLGQNNEKRLKIAKEIMADLRKMGIINIDTNYRPGKREVRLIPDYNTVAQSQLNVAAIATTIRTAYDGTVVTYLQTPDEKVPFRVILDEKKKDFSNPVRGLLVRNYMGDLVPLERLVKRVEGQAPEGFYHYNSYRSTKVTGSVDSKKMDLQEAYNILRKKYRDFEKSHPGFRLLLGGEAEKGQEFMMHMGIAIVVAIIIIYFILVVQFNSFLQPSMVILAIPYGLVGIMLAFASHRIPLSMLALIGILGFTGVVINDSLIMVDFINQLRKEKEESRKKKGNRREEFIQAVIEGAGVRLRPIVLTTITTVVGLIPTAYGLIGGFDSYISPLVMAMTWGLMVGTTSVLIVIPVFYVIQQDMRDAFSRFIARLAGRLRLNE